jgi:CBS domain-containing protein
MLCSEIMKRRVHTATPEMTAREAAQLMSQQSIGFLPVCDQQGRPLGVLTDRDIALRVCARGLSSDATAVADPLCTQDSSSLDTAETLMLDRKTRRVLILDDAKHLVGLITLADIAHHQDPFKIAHFVRALTEKRLRVER